MIKYKKYIKNINSSLNKLTVTDNQGKKIVSQAAFIKWCEVVKTLREKSGTLFIIGNGASAAMASHMTADAAKNGGIKCLPLNDIAMLTATSNDLDYSESYSNQLDIYGNKEDLLITISSSGNSPNIIKAIKAAEKKKIRVITLSGMKLDNLSRHRGILNFFIDDKSYGIVESCHQVIMHCWLDMYMEKYNTVKLP